MQDIYVILVEPVYKGNVGAIARIMNNFECFNLRIVGAIPQNEDFYLAMHSEEILNNAEIYDCLDDAIKDMDRTVALSRRKGSKKVNDFNPRQLSEYLYECKNLKTGLVFGRETFGLTDEEAEKCDLRCYINANKNFPSLNLAQAVAVILYEIYNNRLNEEDETPLLKYEKNNLPATKEMITESTEYVLEVLKSIRFFEKINDEQAIKEFFEGLLFKSNAVKQTIFDLKKIFNRIHLKFHGKGKGFKHYD